MKDTFLEEIQSCDLHRLADLSENASDSDVKAVVSRGVASNLEDFAILISPAALKYIEQMARISAGITRRYFGRTMRIFAPLYVSNQCVNNCVYCGFAVRNKIERRTLSLQEVAREVDAVHSLGFRNILLVASENPKLVSSGYMEDVVRIAARKMPSVSIEIAPSSVEDYSKYVAAGCEGLTVFQETYDPEVYPTLHPSGPKSVYEWRLATPERGAKAGMRKLGLGPLLGVNRWRYEMIAVALHAKFLTHKAWRSQISISLPRMRPAEGGYVCKPGNIPSDSELVLSVCALRMFLSRLAIVVSTRESRALRDGLMGLGVTQMSAFSSTMPGGYADRKESGEQFRIDDSRSPSEFAEALKAKGLDPVWKDFDSALI